jgi:hypothetical protein
MAASVSLSSAFALELPELYRSKKGAQWLQQCFRNFHVTLFSCLVYLLWCVFLHLETTKYWQRGGVGTDLSKQSTRW